jgi:hypothetical protein
MMVDLRWCHASHGGTRVKGAIHLRMRNTPVAVSVSKVSARLHDLGHFLARSTSHPVLARSDCTKILLAAAGLKRTRPFCEAGFLGPMGSRGSSTWIRQD